MFAMPGENVQARRFSARSSGFNFENVEEALVLEEKAQRQGLTDGGFTI